MKIVQINAVYEYSSTGRTTREMDLYLQDHGHQSYKFYSEERSDSNKYDLIGNKNDHKIHAIFSRLLGRQGWFSHTATRKLLTKLDDIHPDVVVLRVLHGNFINIPMLLKYLAINDIATVVVLHDVWTFTGHCCYYTENKCDKWMTCCHDCPALNKDNKSWFFDNSKKNFLAKKELFNAIPRLAVVGVSDWVANEARKSPIFGNVKIIQRIYNWIDLEVFKPMEINKIRASLGLSTDDFIILGVAQNWSDKKGLSHFLKLANNYPDCKIVMVGGFPKGVNLPVNVIKTGTIGSVSILAELYACADVFLNFSVQETFGKVTAESVSAGTPIIVNDATATPELCGNGCGYVVKFGEWDKIGEYVSIIKKNGKTAYQDACVKFAHETFDKNKNMRSYISLFEKLCSLK